MSRRYAESTAVPVDRSVGEVRKLLKATGADQIGVYEDASGSAVAFRTAARFYRIKVPRNAKTRNAEQEERRAWRLMLLLIKAKVEAVREGASTFEREFLADMLMPDGSTVGERAAAEVAIAYTSGQMPASLLMLEGPK